jgi:hypothetical protein
MHFETFQLTTEAIDQTQVGLRNVLSSGRRVNSLRCMKAKRASIRQVGHVRKGVISDGLVLCDRRALLTLRRADTSTRFLAQHPT